MLDPLKYKYTVVIITEDKKQYDITDYIKDDAWEEEDGELAARISFLAKNDSTSKGRLSALAKPGCWVGILYSYNGGKKTEACRGRIVEWNPSATATQETFQIKAYDCLYDLQESQDNLFFANGTKTKSVVTKILQKWGLTVGTYSGPNVKHSKLVYKTEKLGTVLTKVLKEAKKKGGKDAFLRGSGTKTVSVLSYGSNSTVYHLEETQHMMQVSHKISTASMITRVKIVGKENKNGSSPVEATVDGQTKYGIRQKIETSGKDDKLSEAKKTAKEELEENGKPKETITIQAPDMPVIRKGDMVHLKTSTITAGYYIVKGIKHDCDAMTMTLDLDSTSNYKMDDASDSSSSKAYKVGDTVTFHGGNKHYVSSYKGAKGYTVKGTGPAKITKIRKSAAHPYHLKNTNWAKTHVYGWVDEGTFD